jgi:hypothetical protein
MRAKSKAVSQRARTLQGMMTGQASAAATIEPRSVACFVVIRSCGYFLIGEVLARRTYDEPDEVQLEQCLLLPVLQHIILFLFRFGI